VLDALRRAQGFLSAQALHARLRADGETIALSTVYRALRILAHTGQIDSTHHHGGEQLFHAGPDARRHHYLLCRHCALHVLLDTTIAEHWASTVAAEHGYTDIHTVVELEGICGDCA
jgi:Fur family ferric uptake transcriptional regulator